MGRENSKKVGNTFTLSTIIFFYFLSICVAQTPFLQSFSFNSEEDGEYFTLENLNLNLTFQTNLNLTSTLTGNCNITLCLSYLIAPYPDYLLWNEGCDFLYTFSESPSTVSLNPLLGLYQVNAYSQYQNCNVTIEATGNQCANNTYGENCSPPLPLPQLDQITIAAGSQLTFYYSLNTSWTNHLQFLVECDDNCQVELYGREGNVPYINDGIYDLHNDTVSNQLIELNFPYPRLQLFDQQNPFIYFLTVVNQNTTNDTKIIVAPVVTFCKQYYIGENCSNLVPVMLWGYTYQLSGTGYDDEWSYAFLFVDPGTEESFSFGYQLLGDNQTTIDEDVKIYWRFGNIPTPEYYDILISSTSEVTLPNPLYYNADETLIQAKTYWYFAVNDPQQRNFGVWFNIDCPYSCAGSGTCNTTNHLCSCNSEDESYFGCLNLDSVGSYYYDFADGNSSPVSYYLIVVGAVVFFVAILVILVGAAVLKSKFSSSYNQI